MAVLSRAARIHTAGGDGKSGCAVLLDAVLHLRGRTHLRAVEETLCRVRGTGEHTCVIGVSLVGHMVM